jgi:hypothetical protein
MQTLILYMIHRQSRQPHKPTLIPDFQFTFLLQLDIFQMVFLLIFFKYLATRVCFSCVKYLRLAPKCFYYIFEINLINKINW